MALTDKLTAIGNAIREKNGTTELIPLVDMPQAILDIVSGGGAVYESIVYNEDNTITLTDKDGVVHTMSCTYEDDKLIGVTYDGKAVELIYDGDVLVKAGGTVVDVSNAPASGGTSLNIAYGEEPPEDTSKLWIKANEPNKLLYSNNIDGVESIKASGAYLTTDYSADRPCIAKIDTKLYIFRGTNVWIYETDTKVISNLGSILPYRLYSSYCYVEDNKIYLIGGDGIGNCYVFDSETNETTKLFNSSIINYMESAYSKVGNKVYIIGGYRSTTKTNKINVIDLETQEAQSLSVVLPYKISNMAFETVGNKVYLFGGSASGYIYKNEIYVFDIETQTIETLETTLPEACSSMGSYRIGNKIYLFGGVSDSGKLNTVNVFDIETETIETLESTLPNADCNIGCYGEGTKIYLFGGYTYGESINVFVLTHELQQGNIEIETSVFKNKFNLVNTDNAQIEIGVENVYIGNENNEAVKVEAYLHNGTEWMVIE